MDQNKNSLKKTKVFNKKRWVKTDISLLGKNVLSVPFLLPNFTIRLLRRNSSAQVLIVCLLL